MKKGIIILGHGSRREDANDEIKEIFSKLQVKNPETIYRVAFFEFGKPSLVDAVQVLLQEKQVEKVIIMPLFLTVGNHIYKNIPEQILRLESAYPHVKFAFARHLGPDRRIVEIVEDRIKEAEEYI